MTALVNFIIVLAVAGAVILVLRYLRPKLREQRHRRWEEAGLLPHQVDPYAPRPDEDDKPQT
ncbi:hypothetical protein [Flexivirga sp. B27]